MHKSIISPLKVYHEAVEVERLLMKEFESMKPKTWWQRRKFRFSDQREYFKTRKDLIEVMFTRNMAREYIRRQYLEGYVSFDNLDPMSWEQFIVYSYQARN
ncbi:hypothetical protein NCTGTJJY_CDS0028 [Serratia phage 92A1]|nr:hypothetical protein NCTGTJJY_CDS0028 [Serratia phage 92A1]